MAKYYLKIFFLFITIAVISFTIIKLNSVDMEDKTQKNPNLNSVQSKENPNIKKQSDHFIIQNQLEENFVRDFYRYECKSIKRYGTTYQDPMYRIDGKNYFEN